MKRQVIYVFGLLLCATAVLILSAGSGPVSAQSPTDAPAGAWLGVALTESGDELLIARVTTGSPAEIAGIRVGDVLVSLDNQPVTTIAQVRAVIAAKRPDDMLAFAVRRGEQTVEGTLTLAAQPPTPTLLPTSTLTLPTTPTAPPTRTRAQPTVTPAAGTPSGRTYQIARFGFSVLQEETGLRVTALTPNGIAARAGLRVNDLLVVVSGIQATPANAPRILSIFETSTDRILITLNRNGRNLVGRLTPPGGAQLTVTPAAGTPLGGTYQIARFGFTVLQEETGLRVTALTPNGIAARVGLRVNDLLVVVSGIQATPANTPRVLSILERSTARILITLNRDGRNLVARLTPPGGITPTAPPPDVGPTPRQNPSAPNARPQLGVIYDVITPNLARVRNLSVNQGALVVQVVPNSPAELAGIRPGDIILEVDGDPLDLRRTLYERLLAYNPGDQIILTIQRGNERFRVRVYFINTRTTALG